MLLTAMGYDRYVAICNPLRYATVMSRRMCAQLAAISWTIGIMDAMPPTFLLSSMSFCGHQTLDNFFCEVPVLIQLMCSDITSMVITTFIIGFGLGATSSIITLTSYFLIIAAILRIRSAAGRRQAFSTCSAHLTALLLFYGTVFSAYLKPTSVYAKGQEKIFSLLYAGLIPMLNPVIYTLRNKEVKKALKRTSRKDTNFIDNSG
ncbi:olfactory receptor 5G9-like [Lissotriton helveticus]